MFFVKHFIPREEYEKNMKHCKTIIKEKNFSLGGVISKHNAKYKQINFQDN